MSVLRVDITGYAEFETPNFLLNGVAEEGAGIILKEIGRLMDMPKSGAQGRFRRASAPGEAPAKQTGTLWESFEIDPINQLEAEIVSELASTGYGYILQEHRDRPFVEPAIANTEDQITKLVEDRLEEGWR